MEELAATPTRDDFIKFIDERIGSVFSKDSEKELWVNERDTTTGQQVVIVNGQRTEHPGQTIHVTSMIEVVGDGSVKDIESEVEEPFIQVEFRVQQGDSPIEYLGPEMCLYYDDNVFFNSLINQFFGI